MRCGCGHFDHQHSGNCIECDCPAFTDTVQLVDRLLNGKWSLRLPAYRAYRPQWRTGWEPERLDSMSTHIKPGDVVFDIGAEQGDMTALCALFAGPEGRVVAFEPNQKAWPSLRAVFEANGFSDRLAGKWVGFASDMTREPRQGGFTDWPPCAFWELDGETGFSVLAQEADAIPQIMIDDYVALSGLVPDVITMDIEGAEYRALTGAVRTLRNSRPLVYVSVHPQFMHDTYATDSRELFAFMTMQNYEAHHLATDHEEHWMFVPLEGLSR